jgi:hypothetical protein
MRALQSDGVAIAPAKSGDTRTALTKSAASAVMTSVLEEDDDLELMSIPKLPFEIVDEGAAIFPPTMPADVVRRPATHPEARPQPPVQPPPPPMDHKHERTVMEAPKVALLSCVARCVAVEPVCAFAASCWTNAHGARHRVWLCSGSRSH